MALKVGDKVVIVKENLEMPVPSSYTENLNSIFTIKKITKSNLLPYECSIEGVDMSFAFEENEIELANNELAKVKCESKVF